MKANTMAADGVSVGCVRALANGLAKELTIAHQQGSPQNAACFYIFKIIKSRRMRSYLSFVFVFCMFAKRRHCSIHSTLSKMFQSSLFHGIGLHLPHIWFSGASLLRTFLDKLRFCYRVASK